MSRVTLRDAARVPLIEGGSILHWLLGHLVASRDGLLDRVGAWHETYHLGQAMLYRRSVGLASPIG